MWLLLGKVMKFEFARVLEKERITLYDYHLNPMYVSHTNYFLSAVMDLQPREHMVTKESLLV